MRTSHIITGAVLIAALVIGCSKSSGAPLPAGVTDLELSTNAPSHITIDSSHDCTINTIALQDGRLLLRLNYKSAGSVKTTPPVKLVLSPGHEFTIQTEGMAEPLHFRAKLKEK